MGLIQNERKTYLSINGNGKIAQRLKQQEPGCNTRTTEDGKTIYEFQYDGLEGRITGLSIYEHNEWGKYLNVVIDNEFVLQLKFSSRYFYSFCYALPNVDLSKSAKLNPWRKQDGDKVKSALYINQGGKTVDWHFTRDTPNGLPDMEQKKVKGKMVWDDTERLDFMENYLKDTIFPRLSSAAVHADITEPSGAEESSDDLPF